jgi:hypothetical protein
MRVEEMSSHDDAWTGISIAGRVAAALALALLSSERGGDCIPSALATSNNFHSLN